MGLLNEKQCFWQMFNLVKGFAAMTFHSLSYHCNADDRWLWHTLAQWKHKVDEMALLIQGKAD